MMVLACVASFVAYVLRINMSVAGEALATDLAFSRVQLGIVLGALLLGLSWVALYAASIARRRIRLTTDQPIKVLYDVIGAAGDPPRDQSYLFALVAIVLLMLAALAIPVVVSVLFV